MTSELENNPESQDNIVNQETVKTNIESPVSEWQDLLGSGSILKKVITEGEPDTRPQRLQRCTINYKLSCNNESIETRDNFELQLGDCDVVQGLDIALGLMNVKERCLLLIEPRLAFGSKGLFTKIPPNAKVLYDVELVEVNNEEDPDVLTIRERKLQGNKKRERGNWWYGRGEYTLAIHCYRRALDYLDEVESGINDPCKTDDEDNYNSIEKEVVTDAALQELLEDRINVCNNMAAAQIKLELYDAALNSLQTVLRCQPNNIKALFRKAKIYRVKNDLPAAFKCLSKANEISPCDLDIVKEMVIIRKIIKKQKVSEKELARRMFRDVFKDKHNIPKKNNILLWTATAAASFAIGLAGVAAYRLKYA